jgi:hypothetical protein
MNKLDRNKMAMALRRLARGVGRETDAFREAASALLDTEDEKISNMPESLQSSGKVADMQESRDLLSDTLDKIDSVSEAVDSIVEGWDVDTSKGRILPTEPSLIPTQKTGEVKSERLFCLVTPSMRRTLDAISQETGKSLNVVVNEAILSFVGERSKNDD